MDTRALLDTERHSRAHIGLAVCLAVLIGAVVVASLAQRDFGRIEVSNVHFLNANSILIRAKLLRPVDATAANPAPGNKSVAKTNGTNTNLRYLIMKMVKIPARRVNTYLCNA